VSTPLGDFIRAKRDATRPESLGLPVGARRRAPGLRRSELATLAGISVEYLTRIEQGTDQNPSIAVIKTLANTLGLDAAEHQHLQHLAKITGGACVGAPLEQPRREVRRAVLEMLDLLEPGIALVTNRLGDILAHTTGFELLARPTGLLDPDEPNLTRYVFTDDRAHEVFPDWDSLADDRAFDLWMGPSAGASALFQAELAPIAGAAFTDRVNRHVVPARGTLRWAHPTVGELRLNREILELPAHDAQQLVIFLPADDATAESVHRLRRIDGAPLRAVN
jgi:transcriptional regulator with XRE-family HTH domain